MTPKSIVAALALGSALLPSTCKQARAQMVTGAQMQNFGPAFGLKLGEREYPFEATFTQSSAPGNVLWPGESASFSFQLINNRDAPIQMAGRVELIPYGTRGIPGDIWKPEVFRDTSLPTTSVPISVNLGAKGFQNLSVSPRVPAKFGGYALVVDLGEHGRQFITSFVRTFKASPQRLQYPKMSLDYLNDDILRRLGVQAIRMGVDYVPSDDPGYPEWKQKLDESMKRLKENNITALVMWGTGHRKQPLGRGRPHLDDNGVMMGGKEDIAWLPSSDKDFQEQCRLLSKQYGWPRGPVTAMSLWNEPWEGLSISGWGADMIRYREMFSHMARGVEQSRASDKVQVLLAGADSSSNTFDKFFADGKSDYLKWLDAVTIHYQGLGSPSTHRAWINRKSPRGRVKVWDTESWVANTDDRLAAVVAVNRASGYDRSMGIFGGNIATEHHSLGREIFNDKGEKKWQDVQPHLWSPAASVGAVQHFIGERPFRSVLFPRGLPWVMLFDGQKSVDDGTVVVVGDIGETFGYDNILFRGVRGQNEIKAKQKLRAQMMVSRYTPEGLAQAQAKLESPQVLEGGSLAIPASADYSLFDFYGNAVAARNNKISVPLDNRGFFLRPSGKKGSYARLISALKNARVEGFEPLDIIARDMIAPIQSKPTLRLTISNILNRAVKGALDIKLGALKIEHPKYLSFAPFESKQVLVRVIGGVATGDNAYQLSVRFNGGRDGVAEHDEEMHANVIARRSVQIDGDLSDWKGVIPQPVRGGDGAREMTEAAWFPFTNFGANVSGGVASGYTAYDSKYFYFATKIADSSPHPGSVRFETRNDDAYFYPAKSQEYDKQKTLLKQDGDDKPKGDDLKYLQTSTWGERSGKFWEHTDKNLSFAIDLDLPWEEQVAVYLGAGELHSNGIELQMIDRESGKVLDTQKISNLWGGTYAVWNAIGKLRLRVQTNGDWYSAKVFGLFFGTDRIVAYDRATNPFTAATSATWVKWDHDTRGDWIKSYGGQGQAIVGQPYHLPESARLSVPSDIVKKEYAWPQGVRRYSYRTWPSVPGGFGQPYDGVQIAFNALPVEQEDMLPNPPGTPKYFTDYKSTDYEYDLHPVAPKYGGGTEVWRLLVPGMPRKHFYPRQPKSKFDGAVKSARLSVKHVGNTRIMEAAIPWSEIPHVRALMQKKLPVKFGFLVQDDKGPGQMETARSRSVSKKSGLSFHVDWGSHWANEVEFGWDK